MSTNIEPQASSIVFKELKVQSYQQLIEALNFNFSRIANSPLFRGKSGRPGDIGDAGRDGIRGNRLFYISLTNWNNAFAGATSDITLSPVQKVTVDMLNTCMQSTDSDLYTRLLKALQLDSPNEQLNAQINMLLDYDWAILPDGKCCILQNIYDTLGNVIRRDWIYSEMQIMLNDDEFLRNIIIDEIKKLLNTEAGIIRRYSIVRHMATDAVQSETNLALNQGDTSTLNGHGGALQILVPDVTNSTQNVDSTLAILTIANTTGNEIEDAKWPITVIGTPIDYYNTINNTLPDYESQTTVEGDSQTPVNSNYERNINFTPGRDNSVPSMVIMQHDKSAGVLFGKRPNDNKDSVEQFHNFAHIVKTETGVLLRSRFSRYDTYGTQSDTKTRYFDEFVHELFLANDLEHFKYTNNERDYSIDESFYSYLLANDFELRYAFNEPKNITGKDEFNQTISKGIDYASNQHRVTKPFFTVNKYGKVPDFNTDGKFKLMPLFAFGQEIAIKLPNAIANGVLVGKNGFLTLADFDGDTVADIKHQHHIPYAIAHSKIGEATVESLTNANDTLDVYTYVTMPLTDEVPLPDTYNVLVLVDSYVGCTSTDSTSLKAAELQVKTNYTTLQGNTIEDATYSALDDGPELMNILAQTIKAFSAMPAYAEFIKSAHHTHTAYVIKDFEAYYKNADEVTLPSALVIKQSYELLAKTADVSKALITSPKVIAIPLVTAIGVDRHDAGTIELYTLIIDTSNYPGVVIKFDGEIANPPQIQFNEPNQTVRMTAELTGYQLPAPGYIDITVSEKVQTHVLEMEKVGVTLTLNVTQPNPEDPKSTLLYFFNGIQSSGNNKHKYTGLFEETVAWQVKVDASSYNLYEPKSGSYTFSTIEDKTQDVSLTQFVEYGLKVTPANAKVTFNVDGSSPSVSLARKDFASKLTNGINHLLECAPNSDFTVTISASEYVTKTITKTDFNASTIENVSLVPYCTLTVTVVQSDAQDLQITLTADGYEQQGNSIKVPQNTNVAIKVSATGYDTFNQTIKVTQISQQYEVDLDMSMMLLTLDIQPEEVQDDVTIKFNGLVSELPSKQFAYGTEVNYEVIAEHWGSSNNTGSVTMDGPKNVPINFARLDYEVTFTSTDSQIKVFVDNLERPLPYTYTGKSESYLNYEFRKPGHVSESGRIQLLEPTKTISKDSLQVAQVKVKVILSPTTASLKVNGYDTYTNGQTLIVPALSKLTGTASASDYEDKEVSLTVNDNRSSSIANQDWPVSLDQQLCTVTVNVMPKEIQSTAQVKVSGAGVQSATYKHGDTFQVAQGTEVHFECTNEHYNPASGNQVVTGIEDTLNVTFTAIQYEVIIKCISADNKQPIAATIYIDGVKATNVTETSVNRPYGAKLNLRGFIAGTTDETPNEKWEEVEAQDYTITGEDKQTITLSFVPKEGIGYWVIGEDEHFQFEVM